MGQRTGAVVAVDAVHVAGGRGEAGLAGLDATEERDPARAWMTGAQLVRFRWPGRTIELRSRGQIESDATVFHVALHVEITMDGRPHFSRRWLADFRRHLL